MKIKITTIFIAICFVSLVSAGIIATTTLDSQLPKPDTDRLKTIIEEDLVWTNCKTVGETTKCIGNYKLVGMNESHVSMNVINDFERQCRTTCKTTVTLPQPDGTNVEICTVWNYLSEDACLDKYMVIRSDEHFKAILNKKDRVADVVNKDPTKIKY